MVQPMRWIICLLLSLCVCAPSSFAQAIPAGFNDEGIHWHDFDEGQAKAEAEGKAIFVVVHATWCPTCRAYRKLFFDPRVEAAATDVVFVLVDEDAESEVAKNLVPDGAYVPRSFVIIDGVLRTEIRGGRDDFKFFLDTSKPDELLGVLAQAMAAQ